LVVNLIGVCPSVMFSYSQRRSVSLAFQLYTFAEKPTDFEASPPTQTHTHTHRNSIK